jgi:hypothetical protein
LYMHGTAAMTLKPNRIIATLVCAAQCMGTEAATSRSAWLVNDICSYNHPYAATDSADLATKMQLTGTSAFYFLPRHGDIFDRDKVTFPPSAYTAYTTGFTWLGGHTHLDNFGAERDLAQRCAGVARSKRNTSSPMIRTSTQPSPCRVAFRTTSI